MIAATVIAIQLIHPKMSDVAATRFADIIDRQAIVSGVDSLAFVATIEHESKFRSNIVSDDGEDYGLMQVRARFYPRPKEWLFNPEVNIKAGAYIVKVSVDICRKHLGREPDMAEWMTLYVGQGGKKETFCRPTKLSSKRAAFRDCLSNAVFGTVDISECREIYYGKA